MCAACIDSAVTGCEVCTGRPGAGVSSICHVAPKPRLFSKMKATQPKTNLGLVMIRLADSFRMMAEDFEKQNKKSQEMDSHFQACEETKISNQHPNKPHLQMQ